MALRSFTISQKPLPTTKGPSARRPSHAALRVASSSDVFITVRRPTDDFSTKVPLLLGKRAKRASCEHSTMVLFPFRGC